uniref:ethanolamine kinase n=1 Tax=Tetranychus urticae TaxID=32264 RepID=T1JSN3_TETUR
MIGETGIYHNEDNLQCRQLCSEFIAGPWKDLTLDEITVTPIEDGLSNRIYACTNLKLTSSKQSGLTANIPAKLVVRLHGSSFVGDQGDMIVVSMDALPLIGEKLYQKGFAPKIYGVFKEGRIERYIEEYHFQNRS